MLVDKTGKNLKTYRVAQWFETIEENATPPIFLYVIFCPLPHNKVRKLLYLKKKLKEHISLLL